MKKTIASATVAMALLLGTLMHAEETDAAAAPRSTLETYFQALQEGDIESAENLTVNFETIPQDVLTQLTVKFSEGVRAGKLTIRIVPKSAKVIEDCAVITFENGNKDRPDYDPAYLVKQAGNWRVFLKLTVWQNPAFEITQDQQKRFAELEQWFKQEKERLQDR